MINQAADLKGALDLTVAGRVWAERHGVVVKVCNKTGCHAPGRLRRRERLRLFMPRLDGTCETRCERLDRARAAHNPEAGGSNPPPATENCLMA
jgi:hypothetical protein